jgi:NAD(P)-dependent dehydrogenase (short-subunit alcohol dehydrogenase family)
MDRKLTAVVTGAGSGIGLATLRLLRARGYDASGIDIRNADLIADLSQGTHRRSIAALVETNFPRGLDAFIACAGISTRNEPKVVSVNYFGAVELFEGLRNLLAKSPNPRAVAVASFAAVLPADSDIVEACLAGDEGAALEAAGRAVLADPASPVVYISSKLALARWIRRAAITAEWAGSGILLNGIAPGTVATPMMAAVLADADKSAKHRDTVPRVLARVAKPEDIAELLAFLASRENGYMVGQVVYVDGGAEASLRTERV